MALRQALPNGYKHSYWHNLGAERLCHLTVGQLVDIAADRWRDGEALVSVYEDQRLTFGEAREKADRLAAGLLQLGLRPGDVVGLWGPNSSNWYISRLAAARAGFICVQIVPAYQAPELLHSLTKVGVKALIFSEFFKSNSCYQIVRTVIPELDSCPESGVRLQNSKVPSLQFLIIMGSKQYRGTHKLDDIMTSASPESVKKIRELQPLIQPDEVCTVQYSSGTTGHPKATMGTHHALVNNAIIAGKCLELDTEMARHIMCPQLCHTTGSIGGIICGLCYGNTVIIAAPTFDAQKTLDAIQQERCTHITASPAVCSNLIASAAKLGVILTTLEVLSIGGAPCSQQAIKDAKDKLNIRRVSPMYGMTEIGYCFLGRPGDSVDRMSLTVGRVCDHMEAKVVDTDGRLVPFGSSGELWVRGYSVMQGYWGDKEKTDELIRPDGWTKTGDLFVLEEDGYGRFIGRSKDVIIKFGDKIFPVDLEEFFLNHPDVLEAVVFGVPDPKVGEEVCVYLRVREGVQLSEADIVQYCRDKIADYRIPGYIRFIEEFPRTPMGKILRPQLHRALLEELAALAGNGTV